MTKFDQYNKTNILQLQHMCSLLFIILKGIAEEIFYGEESISIFACISWNREMTRNCVLVGKDFFSGSLHSCRGRFVLMSVLNTGSMLYVHILTGSCLIGA